MQTLLIGSVSTLNDQVGAYNHLEKINTDFNAMRGSPGVGHSRECFKKMLNFELVPACTQQLSSV